MYLEAPDALILADPLAPPEGTAAAAKFWQRGEVAFWLPEQRALVPADVIDGVPGGLCLLPDSWLAEDVTPEAQRESLLPLLELPIDIVLVSHGEPILVDGHAALVRALGA